MRPARHGDVLVALLDRYLARTDEVRISTLDLMSRGVAAGRGRICTFTDCLGEYLAVGPDGSVYPCQRFIGLDVCRLGHVRDGLSAERLEATPVWRAMADRQARVEELCAGCDFQPICRAGCPYNAMTAAPDRAPAAGRDPHCEAYRRLFGHVSTRAVAEVFAPENLARVVERPDARRGLLRQGALLQIMNGDPHPRDVATHAIRTLAAVALAAADSAEAASRAMAAAGVPSTPHTAALIRQVEAQLRAGGARYNNLYLHVTFACPLRCTHCYADAGPTRDAVVALAPALVIQTCLEAAALGFRHVVVTGGEPLAHPQRDQLLDALAAVRSSVGALKTVLRTSLASPLDARLLERIGRACHETVVSVDGDRATHDARRGAGQYERTVANLAALLALRPGTAVSLACVLPTGRAAGPEGEAVRALARELGVGRVRMRPVLPIGRAAASAPDVVPDTIWGAIDPAELAAFGVGPASSCGIGHNLYVEPGGRAFPCYAWHGEPSQLGCLDGAGSLARILESERFRDLIRHTVDTNERCGRCALRYLCGGACRAWSHVGTDKPEGLDAGPPACDALHDRARQVLVGALARHSISTDRWTGAGLPLPDAPPPRWPSSPAGGRLSMTGLP